MRSDQIDFEPKWMTDDIPWAWQRTIIAAAALAFVFWASWLASGLLADEQKFADARDERDHVIALVNTQYPQPDEVIANAQILADAQVQQKVIEADAEMRRVELFTTALGRLEAIIGTGAVEAGTGVAPEPITPAQGPCGASGTAPPPTASPWACVSAP